MPADLEMVLENASEEDLRIIRDGFGLDPEDALRETLYSGRRMFTGFINDVPVCLFGSYQKSALDSDLYVWMLSSKRLRKCPLLFWRHCVPILQQLTRGHKDVFAIVDPEYSEAIRWVSRLGFTQVDSINLNRGQVIPLMKLTEPKWLS